MLLQVAFGGHSTRKDEALQRLKKRNQRFSILRRKGRAEFVALDGAGTKMESLRHVVRAKPGRIEPLLEQRGSTLRRSAQWIDFEVAPAR